jgi:hypothetical protein
MCASMASCRAASRTPSGHVGDLGQQRVRDAPAGDRGHPNHVSGVVGEPIEANEQQVGELGGQHVGAGAVDGRRDELLGEEGIALRTVDDPADLRLGHRLGVQRPDELADLVLVQWRQVQALDARQPGPFGDGPPKWMTAVQIVAAVAHDQGDALVAQPGEQEADQLAGGLVGPVDVLGDEQHRRALGQCGQRTEYGFEERTPLDPVIGRGRGRTDDPLCRHQASDRRELGEQRVGEFGSLGDQAPERLTERDIGHPDVAEIDAMTDQRDQTAGVGSPGQLAQQAGLAYARVAGQHHRAGAARSRGIVKPLLQRGELDAAADERTSWTGHICNLDGRDRHTSIRLPGILRLRGRSYARGRRRHRAGSGLAPGRTIRSGVPVWCQCRSRWNRMATPVRPTRCRFAWRGPAPTRRNSSAICARR